MTLHCEHCGSEGVIQVQLDVQAPGDAFRNLPKKRFSKPDVTILGVHWDTMDFICGNPACGRVREGYSTRVDELKQRIAELEAQLRAATAIQMND